MVVKINKDHLTVLQIIFILLPMLRPTEEALGIWMGSYVAGLIEGFLDIWEVASLFLVLILLLNKIIHKKHMPKLCTWLIIGIDLVYLIATVNSGSFGKGNYSILSFCKTIAGPLSLFLLADIFAEDNFRTYIQAVYYYITIQSLITAVTIYLYYPNGMYTNAFGNTNYYFLGLDNISFLYALNGFIACVAYYRSMNRKMSTGALLVYVFIGGSYIYCQTGTGMVCIALLILFCLFYTKKIADVFDYKKSLIISIAGMLFIIFAQNFTLFSGILTAIGKDSSLSGRILIWASGLSQLSKHPIIGIGVSDAFLTETIMRGGMANWGRSIGHMHNVLLEIIIKGGVIGTTFFIAMFLSCYRQMQRNKNSRMAQNISMLIPIVALAYSFEYRIGDMTFWIIIIIMHYGCRINGGSQ